MAPGVTGKVLHGRPATVVGRDNRWFGQKADGAGHMKGGEDAKRRLS